MMRHVVRQLNRWQAALLLAAAALALAVGPFHGSEAQEPSRPAPPTGVSAADLTVTATEARVTLTWNPVDNAASYGVWRSGAGAVYTTNTSYTFRGLYPHRTYNLNVWTRTADGVTGPNAGVQVTMPARPGVPQTAAPTNMTLSNVTTSSVTVSWSGVAGATAYQIARSGVGRITLAGTARSHTFTGLTAGRGYSVWLWAIGHGGISNNVRRGFNALPPAPSDLSTTATGTSLTLSWTAVTGATGYEVKHSPGGETPTTVAGASSTSYTFSGLTADTAYTLSVRARNGSGTSAWSEVAKTTALAAPSNLSTTATSTSITLSWDAVTGATSYEVKQGATGTATASSSTTSHAFSGLTASTEYTLYVRAKNSNGTSEWSSLAKTTAPVAPSGLSAEATSTSLTLSWTAVTGATSYEVKQGAAGTATASSSTTSHAFSGLTANTEYTLYVRAKNSGGTSEWSSLAKTTAPAAPSNLYVSLHNWDTTRSILSFRLSWADVLGATSYDVKRGTNGILTTVSRKTTGHTFTGLTAGTEYTLYVRAKNSAGDSAWSSIGATTAQQGAPSGLYVYPGRDNLTLSWAQVTGATGYEVKLGSRGAVTSNLRAKWGNAPETWGWDGHTFTGLTADTEYTLYVRAKYVNGTSDWSSITTTTAIPLLQPEEVWPDNLSVSASNTSLTLSWSTVPGEGRQYQVKRGANGPVKVVRTGASHTFSGLTAGTEYTLFVRAKGGYPFGGTTAWVPITATTTPTPPNHFRVTSASRTRLTLGWGPVAGATSYEVKRNADGAVTAASSNANHTFADLTPGSEYTLYLRGRNGDELFAWRSITAKTEPLLEPANLSVGARTTRTALRLSWDGRESSTDVHEVKLGASGTATTAYGTTHSFWGLTAGTEYTLYVRAKSGPNTEWKSITATTLPAQSSELSATAIGTAITFSWDAVTGATRYGVDSNGHHPDSTTETFYYRTGEAGTEYTFSVRGWNRTKTYPWRSVSVTTPPSQPRSLSATAASTELILSWAAMSGATSYEVKRGAGGTVTTVSSGTSHPFSGLTANTEYTLYVRAKNSGGDSGWSSITTKTAPAAPSGLTATATSDSITLSWTAVTGATSYEIKRSGSADVAMVSSSASYAFTGLTASTGYTVYVRAWNSGGASEWSSLAATTAPLPPDGLDATATDTGITLSWTAVTGATSYEVKQGAIDTATAASSTTSHAFTGLTANTEYTLYVRSKNSGGTSEWSSLTKTTAPAPPSGLSAEATSTSLTLAWTAATGATSYEVKQGAAGTATAASSTTSHTFGGLTANTEYTLYVRSKNSGGTSEWSSLTKTTAPAAPNGLSAEATSTTLTLAWTAVTGATSYEVKQGAAGTAMASSSTISHAFSGLSANAEYTLYVRAKNSNGTSEWSSLAKTTAPVAPARLSVTATNTSLTLSWGAVTGATSYEVKLDATGTETASSSTTSHTFTGLSANTEYTLYVRAKNSGGASDWSSAETAGMLHTTPLPPGGLAVAATSSSLTLSWTAVDSATSYEVKQGAGGAETTVSSGTSYTFPDTSGGQVAGLNPGTEYALYVRAKNSAGASAWSRVYARTSPATPSGLSAAASGASITLSWGAAAGAAGYEVKLGAARTVEAVPAGTRHTFHGLTPGAAYTLYTRARNGASASAWSSLDTVAAPAAPRDLNATATSSTLTLRWTAVTGAGSYEAKIGASGVERTVSSGTSYTFPDTSSGQVAGLTAGTGYTLYVRAKNRGGVSAWSSIGAMTTPSAPGGLNATASSASLKLSWSAVSSVAAYEVKLGASGTAVTVFPSTSHTFSGLTAGTGYTLYVRAKNRGGDSGWSSLDAATAPAQPSDLSVAAASASLTLRWSAVAGATSYKVKLGESGALQTVSSGTSYTFPGASSQTASLTADTEFTLYVRAASSSGDSAWSSISARTTPTTTASATPRVLSVTATQTNLTLIWAAAAGATSYEVKLNATGAPTTVPSGTSHTFSSLATGTQYALYVRSRNSLASSPWSSPAIARTLGSAPTETP